MNSPSDKTFLVCHGAWSGGWSWKKMFPLMQAAGYRLVVPTYTGLGDRELGCVRGHCRGTVAERRRDGKGGVPAGNHNPAGNLEGPGCLDRLDSAGAGTTAPVRRGSC